MIELEENPPEGAALAESIAGRKEPRYAANATVKVDGNELLLKDLSLNGGCIQSQEFIGMVPNGKYTVAIVPERESEVESFDIEILSRWIRMNRNSSETGFIMILPPGSKAMMEDYLEFLKTRALKKR